MQGLLSTAPNKYKTTSSVCDETADTNRPRYSYRLYNLDSSRL